MGHNLPRLGWKIGPLQTMTHWPRFSQNFRGILGNPRVSKMVPFLLANRGKGLTKFLAQIKSADGGLKRWRIWGALSRD